MNGSSKRTTISISRQIKEDLDKLKHPGQSYTGFFRELISFWVEAHKENKK